jgi:hypothetical protein
MLHPVTPETLQRLLRARICTKCPWRPSGTKTLSPDVPRSCEARCPVFARLEALHAIAKYLDPMVGSTDDAVRRLSSSSGQASARPEHDVLTHHQEEIIKIVRQVGLGHGVRRSEIHDRRPGARAFKAQSKPTPA